MLKDWRSIADTADPERPGAAPKRSERRQMTRPGRAPTDALKQKLEGAMHATVERVRDEQTKGSPDNRRARPRARAEHGAGATREVAR